MQLKTHLYQNLSGVVLASKRSDGCLHSQYFLFYQHLGFCNNKWTLNHYGGRLLFIFGEKELWGSGVDMKWNKGLGNEALNWRKGLS